MKRTIFALPCVSLLLLGGAAASDPAPKTVARPVVVPSARPRTLTPDMTQMPRSFLLYGYGRQGSRIVLTNRQGQAVMSQRPGERVLIVGKPPRHQ